MNRIDIMLDLETWGTKPGCDIRSIGACVFDPVAGTVHSELGDYQFYLATNNPALAPWNYDLGHHDGIETYRKYPLTRDPETVQWWNNQSPEAQAAFENPVDLKKACNLFTSWIVNMFDHAPTDGDFRTVCIWANDPHFDVSILAAVFDAVGLPVPWHYRSPRSMKTAIDMAGLTPDEYCNYGTAHNALDDAIAQAMTVCKAYERLGLRK